MRHDPSETARDSRKAFGIAMISTCSLWLKGASQSRARRTLCTFGHHNPSLREMAFSGKSVRCTLYVVH